MDWLDDPAILAGIPLLAIGLIGAAIAMMASFAPERPMALEHGTAVRGQGRVAVLAGGVTRWTMGRVHDVVR